MVAFWLAYAEAHPGYEGMDALEAEAAGLMGALAWAHEQARHREVLRLAKELVNAWRTRGRRAEERQICAWALEMARVIKDIYEEAWLLHALASLNGDQGRLTEARAGFERALALARQLGDPAAEAHRTP